MAKLGEEPGVVLSTGTMVQSLGGIANIQGVDFDAMNKMASNWRKPGDPEPPNPKAGGFEVYRRKCVSRS